MLFSFLFPLCFQKYPVKSSGLIFSSISPLLLRKKKHHSELSHFREPPWPLGFPGYSIVSNVICIVLRFPERNPWNLGIPLKIVWYLIQVHVQCINYRILLGVTHHCHSSVWRPRRLRFRVALCKYWGARHGESPWLEKNKKKIKNSRQTRNTSPTLKVALRQTEKWNFILKTSSVLSSASGIVHWNPVRARIDVNGRGTKCRNDRRINKQNFASELEKKKRTKTGDEITKSTTVDK